MKFDTIGDAKIQYMSDLHLEFMDLVIEKTGDILVLAGDIFSARGVVNFMNFMERAHELDYDAIIMVLGNHEGYGWSQAEAIQVLRDLEEKYDEFHFLHMQSICVNGITFHGCPLWSNPTDERTADRAKYGINDYRAIRGWDYNQHCQEHEFNKAWLVTRVQPGDVVVTHFCPTLDGVNKGRYEGDALNAWYCNSLEEIILELEPAIWISGHTHHAWQQMVGNTMVVGNCRGYARRHHGTGESIPEVPEFDPTKTIKVEIEIHDLDEGAEGPAEQSI